MNMRRLMGFLLVLALFLSFSALSVRQVDAEENALDYESAYGRFLPALTEEAAEKEDAAGKKYNALLDKWAEDPRYPSDTHANFPPFYGGAYINNDKDLVIQTTELSEDILVYFAAVIDLQDVRFEKVEYSFAQLLEEKEQIAAQMKDFAGGTAIARLTGVGISVVRNSVCLHLVLAENADKAAVWAEVRSTISAFPNLVLVSEDGEDSVCTSISTVVGSTTYSRGMASYGQVGTVTDISYTTSYGISDCVVTSASCASGDSGGIVASLGNSIHTRCHYLLRAAYEKDSDLLFFGRRPHCLLLRDGFVSVESFKKQSAVSGKNTCGMQRG